MTLQDLKIIGCGFLMGGADIIPGVSGGTVALILNIYQRLVAAISRFDLTLLQLIKRGQFAAAAEQVDLRFLCSLGIGILAGIASLASLMHYLLEYQQQQTYSVFLGLIAGSSLLVARMVTTWEMTNSLMLMLGAIIAFFVVGLPMLSSPPTGNQYLFLCGAIAICAMILPGISGAFILLILGQYTHITGMLKQTLKLDLQLDILVSIGVFCCGCLVGLIGFSKLLKWLLARYEASMLALLCGFMIGSLRRIWPFKLDLTPDVADLKLKTFENIWPTTWGASEGLSITLALVALSCVLILDLVTKGHEHPTHDVTEEPPLSRH